MKLFGFSHFVFIFCGLPVVAALIVDSIISKTCNDRSPLHLCFFFFSIELTAQTSPIDFVNPMVGTKNMGHTYPGALRPVLADLNLSVPVGEHIAVVGRSGCGARRSRDRPSCRRTQVARCRRDRKS